MSKTSPDIIYLARDMVFHKNMGCDSREEAEKYIKSWSGNGYIEIYQLFGNSYKFKEAEWIEHGKTGVDRGPILGEMLNGITIMESMKDKILNYIK